jgi:hypothetical protein
MLIVLILTILTEYIKMTTMNSSTIIGIIICAMPLVLIIATIIIRGKKLFD